MAYPIEMKLVVGVSSSALFDLSFEDNIFNTEGVEAYKKFQIENKRKVLEKGIAFPFIRRFLNINNIFPDKQPVEVVILSRNSPETGIRTFNSIREYGLDISRAAFTSGYSAMKYIPAYNISLFLSTNISDVQEAIELKYPAGRLLQTKVHDDIDDNELRIAFDFDGVLSDDESEKVYQESHDLGKFHNHEIEHNEEPMNPGLLKDFLQKISYFQKLEQKRSREDSSYRKILKTSIITARNAPAHERAINSLSKWEIAVDEMFLLGGIEKKRVLEIAKPHLFIDDQISHLSEDLVDIPLVHLPFGITNE